MSKNPIYTLGSKIMTRKRTDKASIGAKSDNAKVDIFFFSTPLYSSKLSKECFYHQKDSKITVSPSVVEDSKVFVHFIIR